jgi:hypothetical protein
MTTTKSRNKSEKFLVNPTMPNWVKILTHPIMHAAVCPNRCTVGDVDFLSVNSFKLIGNRKKNLRSHYKMHFS